MSTVGSSRLENEALIIDLLQWIDRRDAQGGAPYEDVLAAWRTSCPRLPVWEDANDLGLVKSETIAEQTLVRVTPLGHQYLDQARERRRAGLASAR